MQKDKFVRFFNTSAVFNILALQNIIQITDGCYLLNASLHKQHKMNKSEVKWHTFLYIVVSYKASKQKVFQIPTYLQHEYTLDSNWILLWNLNDKLN